MTVYRDAEAGTCLKSSGSVQRETAPSPIMRIRPSYGGKVVTSMPQQPVACAPSDLALECGNVAHQVGEIVGGKDEQSQRFGRRHRREARIREAGAPLECGELAEELAGAELRDALSVDCYLHRAFENDIKVACRIPPRHQLLARLGAPFGT